MELATYNRLSVLVDTRMNYLNGKKPDDPGTCVKQIEFIKLRRMAHLPRDHYKLVFPGDGSIEFL